jgi:hypothetical protein
MTKTLFAAMALITLMPFCATLAHGESTNGVAANSAPTVRDARGHDLGTVAHFNYSDGALITVGDARFVVAIERKPTSSDLLDPNTQFVGSQFVYRVFTSSLSYTSADCSGAPIVDDTTLGPSPAIVTREGDTVTAYVAAKAAYQTFTVASRRSTDTQVCTPLDTPVETQGWPTATTVVLSRVYPEPLSIAY